MTRYDHFLRLLVLISFIAAGIVLTALCTAGILLLSGWSVSELMEMDQSHLASISPGITRGLLATQHLFTFILPSIAFGLLFYGRKMARGFDLKYPTSGLSIFLGVSFLLAAYPLVNLSFLVNESISLPEWAKFFEAQAEDTLAAILEMNSPVIFLINLLLIALLPGIGEELVFRGILQKELSGLFRSPIVGIWVAAFIFSAIHMQFEGFLPRMVLGAVLGYLYYWTNNLWVPIIVHAFNNGVQVVLIYGTGIDVSSFDETGSNQLQWWMLPISIAVMYFIYTHIKKQSYGHEQG